MKLILNPGLGYDFQIFDHLDLINYDVEDIKWIEPKTGDKIHDYSQRLFEKYRNISEKITLIRHSFGIPVAQAKGLR